MIEPRKRVESSNPQDRIAKPSMDARNGRAALTQMGRRTNHTSAPLLRCNHGTARFKYKGGGHELDFAWRLIFRAQGFRP